MQNAHGLTQFADSEMSLGELETIAAGRWPFGSSAAPTTNINVNFDVDVINIKGNNNTVSGRDSWIFNGWFG